MKTIGIILAICVLQTWAIPTLEGKNETPKKFDSETVAAFRAAVDHFYTEYATFYDSTNNAMTGYRLEHVGRIRENMDGFMTCFGTTIETLRRRTGNQMQANFGINACAQRANGTMVDALMSYFYPTFQQVQDNTSLFPLIVIDGLRRGNVFNDGDQILEYFEIQYEAFLIQWLQTVSKFFNWEKDKTDINGDFYQDEVNFCLCEHVPENPRCDEDFVPAKQNFVAL